MADKFGSEIFSGSQNRITELRKAYERVIELRTKEKQSPGMEVLNEKELEELSRLRAVVSSNEHTSSIRYKESFDPEEHKLLQSLEAQMHELERDKQ